MSESAPPQIDLEQTLRLMDVADEIRRQHRRVHQHLERSDRERIKEHLARRYEGMGHQADPELLDEAIDIVLAQQYRFNTPSPGVARTLAQLYVRRAELSRKIGLPIVVGVVLVAFGIFAQQALDNRRLARHERAAEQRVAELYVGQRGLRSRVEELAASPARTQLTTPARQQLDEHLASASQRLDRAGQFLDRYAPLGTAEDNVTRSNYAAVEAQAADVALDLEAAETRLQEATGILDDVTALRELVERAGALYRNIGDTARVESARAQAEQHYRNVQRHAKAKDLDRLRESIAALTTLDSVLNQEYTLRIVRGRERDRVRHYLIVQAIDAAGKALEMRIRNEETGAVEAVTEWGERVARSVYDRIASDYGADNVIDDDVFGVKRRGYLEPERRYENLGQITKY